MRKPINFYQSLSKPNHIQWNYQCPYFLGCQTNHHNHHQLHRRNVRRSVHVLYTSSNKPQIFTHTCAYSAESMVYGYWLVDMFEAKPVHSVVVKAGVGMLLFLFLAIMKSTTPQ